MSVMRLYREAWRQEDGETLRQRRRDVVVSILTPLAVLCAMAHTFWMYWEKGDMRLRPVVFFILLGGVLSYRIFVHACRILMEKKAALKEDEKNQPLRSVTMLAFATWLFPMGLFFTIAETYDHLLWPIGPLELEPLTGGIRGGEFSSPWGDALLAFSAFCLLAEEYSLVNLYGNVKKEFETILSLSSGAKKELNKIVALRDDTAKLQKQTREFSTQIREMHIEMRKKRSPFLVFLKRCSVVGSIILLLYVLIKLRKLEDTIKPTNDSTVETSSDSEGFDREGGSGDTGQRLMLLEQTTEDTDESSTMDSTGLPGMDRNRPDGP